VHHDAVVVERSFNKSNAESTRTVAHVLDKSCSEEISTIKTLL
jgi:hypothetical protein